MVAVLTQLADQSLLKVTDTVSGTRFRMLETVREFSTAHRERAGETGRAVDGLMAWAREFGTAEAQSVFGADLVPAAERVRAEQDNLVLALRHGLQRADDATVVAAAAVLAALWGVQGNFVRMTGLTKDTAWYLSHVRPTPRTAETTHTAVLLCAMADYLMRGPLPLRLLVTLRRLPPAPAGTLMGAADTVVRAMIEDLGALDALCASDEPLVAGVASGAASYVYEQRQDIEGALRAARTTLAVFGSRATPWMRAVAHSRIGELCLQLGRGEEAGAHLVETLAVLDALREPGVSSGASRVRGAMALANLQRGAVDEAEHWLEPAAHGEGDTAADLFMFGSSVRAEILLARGDVEEGLALWRRVAGRLRDTAGSGEATGELPGSASWALEVHATAVIAHARHDRLDLVPDLVGDLPGVLADLLDGPAAGPEIGEPVRGALLLALAVADLDRARRTADAALTAAAVRMIALAEALRFLREFQPTMSATHARDLAEQSDAAAYAEAGAAYAGLDRDALRAAASAALRARTAAAG